MQLGPRSNTTAKQLADLRNILAGPDKVEAKRALVAARFCKQERDRMRPSVLDEVCAHVIFITRAFGVCDLFKC